MGFDSFLQENSDIVRGVITTLIGVFIVWLITEIRKGIKARKDSLLQCDLTGDVTDILPLPQYARNLITEGENPPLKITFLEKPVTKRIYRMVVKYTNLKPNDIEHKILEAQPIKITFEDKAKVEILGIYPSTSGFSTPIDEKAKNKASIIPEKDWESGQSVELKVFFAADHSVYPVIDDKRVGRPFIYSFAYKHALSLALVLLVICVVPYLVNQIVQSLNFTVLFSPESSGFVFLIVLLFIFCIYLFLIVIEVLPRPKWSQKRDKDKSSA